MKKGLLSLFTISILALVIIPRAFLFRSGASAMKSKPEGSVERLAGMSDQISIHAAGRGNPWINLDDGRDLLTDYIGVGGLRNNSAQQLAQPLALASADFDEDGVPDLLCGFASTQGGAVTLYRGNEDAIYPNSPGAKQRKANGQFTDAPFLSPASLFELLERPDFLACGDFDADGHQDVAAATRGINSLYFLAGNGQGRFAPVRAIRLEGAVTAMAGGEINRADGLEDLIIGIAGTRGPMALVFEGPEGAIKSEPEVIALPAEATSFALGQLVDDFAIDLAVAAGNKLLIVNGRVGDASATINRRSFSSSIKSVVAGDFTGNQEQDLALLLEGGGVQLLSKKDANGKKKKIEKIKKWASEEVSAGNWPQAKELVRVRVSSLPGDDLVIVDSANRRLQILGRGAGKQSLSSEATASASLDVESEPVTVLPMRLNRDALSDLVVLRKDQSSPTVAMTRIAMTFTVTSAEDSGSGSLREAITAANENAGADLIDFNIEQFTSIISAGSQIIELMTALDALTEAVTIDATTQPGFSGSPIIQLDGSSAPSAIGLEINASNVIIRGLVISGFNNEGVRISTGNGNIIEGNFIGTNIAGDDTFANLGDGVSIFSSSNTIGGTTANARNLISQGFFGEVPTNGVSIRNGATGNIIQGNFIGTNLSGTSGLGNPDNGVLIVDSCLNTIGGTTAGAGNLISSNVNSGVRIELEEVGAEGNQVQGNFIGTDASGLQPLGNFGDGVTISASGNFIGGTSSGTGNIIAFNDTLCTGVQVFSGTGNAILGNSIFSNGGLGINLSDDQVTPNDPGDADTGANNLQNFPDLASAASGSSSTTITGTLDSTPNTTFRIEFFSNEFCDDPGGQGEGETFVESFGSNGEGETFIGSTFVTTNGSGIATINANIPVSVPIGFVITATATDPSNNTSEFSQCALVEEGCNISCPGNISVSNDPGQCGAVVSYTPPIADGTCSNVVCTPASGSTFPLGATNVVCSTSEGPNCSFTVTVTDNEPPNVVCPGNIVTSPLQGQSAAVVNYLPATATDNCPGTSAAVCSPASGTTFLIGVTTVTCTSTDAAGNQGNCTFTVTVNDNEAPNITCPANVFASVNPGQSTALVNYPAPDISDNVSGVTVVCTPPSGSAFPIGVTPVTCTAEDLAGNKSACGFNVSVSPVSAPSLDKSQIDLGPGINVPPNNPPSDIFSIINPGPGALDFTIGPVNRTGPSVQNGSIGNANDSQYFSVQGTGDSSIQTTGSKQLTVMIPPGGQQQFRITFDPDIPAVANQVTGLAANQVLPDLVTSRLTINLSGGAPLTLDLMARVATALKLIDPVNTGNPPVLSFSRAGSRFTLIYSVYDSNLDVSRAVYEFLNSSGQKIGPTLEVNLAQALSGANLVRGQSFTVEQGFSNVSDQTQITQVRVTVSDGETSVTATANLGGGTGGSSILRQGGRITLPDALPARRSQR